MRALCAMSKYSTLKEINNLPQFLNTEQDDDNGTVERASDHDTRVML